MHLLSPLSTTEHLTVATHNNDRHIAKFQTHTDCVYHVSILLYVPVYSVNQHFQTSAAINTLLLGRRTLTINHATKNFKYHLQMQRGNVFGHVCLCVFPTCLNEQPAQLQSCPVHSVSCSTVHVDSIDRRDGVSD